MLNYNKKNLNNKNVIKRPKNNNNNLNNTTNPKKSTSKMSFRTRSVFLNKVKTWLTNSNPSNKTCPNMNKFNIRNNQSTIQWSNNKFISNKKCRIMNK